MEIGVRFISLPFAYYGSIWHNINEDNNSDQKAKNIDVTETKQKYVNGETYILPSNIDLLKTQIKGSYIIDEVLDNASSDNYPNQISFNETIFSPVYIPKYISDETVCDVIDDIPSNNWTNGGDKVKFLEEEHFESVMKTYNFFTKLFEIFIISLIYFTFINPPYLPRIASISGIFIFLIGIIGMNMDKYLRKENHKCL